jgi:hypothetical protein
LWQFLEKYMGASRRGKRLPLQCHRWFAPEKLVYDLSIKENYRSPPEDVEKYQSEARVCAAAFDICPACPSTSPTI